MNYLKIVILHLLSMITQNSFFKSEINVLMVGIYSNFQNPAYKTNPNPKTNISSDINML